MVEQAGAQPSEAETTLEDSRAQFVASLGRRLEALREALAALEQAPRSGPQRDNLRRRIHAFGAAAGVLGFNSVFEAFRESEAILGRIGASGPLGEAELSRIGRTFDLVTSLVHGAGLPPGRPAGAPQRAAIDRRGGAWPTSVLVYGARAIVESLSAPGISGEPGIECEVADDPERAEEIVRVMAPDVAVIDADREGALRLFETLVYDPLLDPVHLVAVGTFDRPEAAASLVALGVARVLPKPVGPDVLRRTVIEVARERGARSARVEPLGTLTVEALGDRVAQEIRRGLVEAVRAQSRGTQVALGEGTDVLAAVWGSVARIRELVTLRSGGAVRFDASGPEGAVPLAPWMNDDRARGATGEQRKGAEVTLAGRTIVVADDDPAIAWFLSGLLRAAGAEVVEALDGTSALELTRKLWPDLVVSDILMPGMDGFSLCREIKRDIALSDVPVILLSWKEDLLQRVHELGAQADGYLRKEASASVVVQRVREVLLPRARVEARLALGGEVKGRLDGLTPRVVLEMVCRRERDARVSIRDAAFLYEVEIRGGKIRGASRTTFEGRTDRGVAVLPALLGVRAGRFAVRPEQGDVPGDWNESLRDALSGPIARTRAALRAVANPSRIGRVTLDDAITDPYLSSTPEPALPIVRWLMEGRSPRDILASGASGRLVESVLADLVLHGAIQTITGPGGEDLWAENHGALSEAPPARSPSPPPALDRALRAAPARAAAGTPAEEPPGTTTQAEISTDGSVMEVTARAVAAALESSRGVTAPVSEASEAVAREVFLSHASPLPPRIEVPAPAPPAPAEARSTPAATPEPADASFLFGDSLVPGAASDPPPEASVGTPRGFKVVAPLTSLPAEPSPFAAALQALPPAHLPPSRASGAEVRTPSPMAPAVAPRVATPAPAAASPAPAQAPPTPEGSRTGPPRPGPRDAGAQAQDLGDAVLSALALGETSVAPPAVAPEPREAAGGSTTQVVASVPATPIATAHPDVEIRRGTQTEPPKSRHREAAKPAQATPPAPPRAAAQVAPRSAGSGDDSPGIAGIVAVVAIAAIATFALFRAIRSEPEPAPSAIASAGAEGTEPADGAESPAPTSPIELTVTELDLPAGLTVLPGRGVLEIQVPGAELVTVAGVAIGGGPERRLPLAAGTHAVQIEGPGLSWTGQVTVTAERRTLVSGPSQP